MNSFRCKLIVTGTLGLVLCAAVAFIAIWLVRASVVVPPLPYPSVALLLTLVLGTFSVAEIPLMVLTLRRLTSERIENRGVVWGLNVVYVGFAAVYGAPVILLTGSVRWGLVLCGLACVRLLSALVFIRQGAPE